jgi:N-acetylglucosaminyldiphosphoundecaprenol N-acetyl-beta-D-mannosaminyltransferase
VAASSAAPRRVDVLGVHISVLNMASAVDAITAEVEAGRPGYVCVTGVHGVMESQADPDLEQIHNRSTLTTPDGVPMVWAGRWARAEGMTRVYGPDLMLAVLERAAERGWTSFFYGGRDGVPEILTERMQERFPGLEVVGSYSPPFRPLTQDEDDALVARVRDLAPDLIWVGLSTPKQERWMAAHLGRLDKGLMFGVGAAFDINAGLLRQAPAWMQKRGLEWLFRLIVEPRRLWKRYLSNNPRFVWRIVRHPPRLLPVGEH